jgi:hypothetical protein
VASIGPSCSRSPTPYTSGTDAGGAPSTGPKRLNRPASPKGAATTLSNQVKTKQSQYLLVGVHVNMALDAVLVGVGPGVAAHPLSLALGTFKFTETPLPALVRRLSFAFRSSLFKQIRGIFKSRLFIVGVSGWRCMSGNTGVYVTTN